MAEPDACYMDGRSNAHGMARRRYQVLYDDLVAAWAVIDTKIHGRRIAHHASKEDAKKAAWFEEERWYKCSPDEA